MSTFRQQWQELWKKIKSAPTYVPTTIDFAGPDAPPFEKDKHYFQVRVDGLFLAEGRQWMSTYDPLVFAVTEVLYDKERRSFPFIIGPALVQKHIGDTRVPQGIVLRTVNIAGPFPYRGGRIVTTVVLCKVRRDNYLSKILKLVEKTAATLGSATPIASYAKVGQVVLDGVETLFDSKDTAALAGLRVDFDPDAGQIVTAGHHALVNKKCDSTKFVVRNNELYYAESADTAASFTEADYVLYEITRSESRNDVESLPFYPLYDKVKAEASLGSEESWKRAKANMLVLWQEMVLSPDLIPGHRDSLISEYIAEMVRLRKTAKDIQSQTATRDRDTLHALDEAVKILDCEDPRSAERRPSRD